MKFFNWIVVGAVAIGAAGQASAAMGRRAGTPETGERPGSSRAVVPVEPGMVAKLQVELKKNPKGLSTLTVRSLEMIRVEDGRVAKEERAILAGERGAGAQAEAAAKNLEAASIILADGAASGDRGQNESAEASFALLTQEAGGGTPEQQQPNKIAYSHARMYLVDRAAQHMRPSDLFNNAIESVTNEGGAVGQAATRLRKNELVKCAASGAATVH